MIMFLGFILFGGDYKPVYTDIIIFLFTRQIYFTNFTSEKISGFFFYPKKHLEKVTFFSQTFT